MGKNDQDGTLDEEPGEKLDFPAETVSPADLMRAELESVLASPDFLRAPTMNRLLAYLVTETAEGRADQLKAYSVAVDGLGRAPDYDARADSYPRVQVGRLRRMLDNYYASSPTMDGYRLAIPSGRYRVTLVADHEPIAESLAAETLIPAPLRATRRDVFAMVILLVAMVGVSILLARLSPAQPRQHADTVDQRPLLELAPIAHDSAGSMRAEAVQATLINGLGRSEMFDLRIARPIDERGGSRITARYRLSSDLVEGSRPRLFLRLWQQSPDQLLWSGDVAMPPYGEGAKLEDVLAPVIATIGQVNGLIAIHEYQSRPGEQALGYRCILLYHRYRRERLTSERETVRQCVERSITETPGDAGMQAIAAHLSLDRMASSLTPPDQRAGLFLAARRHAQLATSINPQSAWAATARTRIAVLRQACPIATSEAMRAADLQPYDPVLLSDAGIALLNCSDPRAETLMRRAIALDDGPDGQFYRPLLWLAVSRGDQALAHEALSRMTPPVFGRNTSFYLVTAAGYTMTGDIDRARAAWRQLKASSAATAADPQSYLERIGLAEPVKREVLRQLRSAKLIA